MAAKKARLQGTLVDSDIAEAVENGELIVANFDKANIKQCCYEATAGSIYYDLSNGAIRISLGQNDSIIVKPKQSVTIITAETFSIPHDMLARILTKGSLFSLGISPVNTYADPGFYGQLGITFYNFRNDYLRIPQRTPIAKIEFSGLGKDVKRPYNGQHGFQTQIWPIPRQFIMTPAEIRAAPQISDIEVEIKRSYGSPFADIYFRIRRYERWLILSAILYFLAMIGLFAYLDPGKAVDNWLSISLGVFANIVTAIVFWASTRFGIKG